MPPKKYVPGYDPVSDDEKAKGAKTSRRKKKGSSKNEPAEAGPSSTFASPSSTQKGPDSAQSVQSSAQTGTRQALSQPGQATMPIRPINTSGQAGEPPPNQGSSALVHEATLATKVLANADTSKGNGSELGGGNQEVVPLKGQPRRPDSNFTKRTPDSVAYLASNHFQLKLERRLVLWHYGIVVLPEIKGPKLTQIIKTALDSGRYRDLKSKLVTDFSAIMLCEREIPPEYQSFDVLYKSELETSPSDGAKKYKISLDLKGTIDLSDSGAYLKHPEIYPSDIPIEQALDIIIGHHRKISDDVTIVNKRKAFTINSGLKGYDSRVIDERSLLALRGYFSSVRMSEKSFLVNINVSHGAFYVPNLELWHLIGWLEGLPNVDRSKVPGLLRGLRVSSSHIPRVWSIWGYPRNGDGKGYMLHPPRFTVLSGTKYTPEQVLFFYQEKPKDKSAERAQALNEKDKADAKEGRLKAHGERCACPGKWLTVAQYFEIVRRERISPKDMQLPLVNVGSNRRPIYLPSHLCQVRPGQISKLRLEGKQTSAMIAFAVRNPVDNAGSILKDGFETLGLTSSTPELKSFGVTVSESMVRLEGRILQQPSLYYGKKTATFTESRWNLDKLMFQTPKDLRNWACTRIILDQYDVPIHKNPCRSSLGSFQDHLERKGIVVEGSKSHGDLDLRRGGPQQLDEWFKSSRHDFKVKFMLVLLPGKTTSELYNSIKRYGDVKHGIHTVCVKTKKFGEAQYDENVALKINLKLGGTNHILHEKSYGPIFKDKTMVVGIDVTHPAPGEDGAPSVAAVVASRDDHLSQWPVDLRINKSRQEMVVMLREMLKTRLEHFREMNKDVLPTNILIYRDGVGEGQYKIVLNEELPRLRDACRDVYGKKYIEGVYPRISLIVVGKRHHTRFYSVDKHGTMKSGITSRPKHGTLVDSGITQNCNWDFYLQSHTAITGTPRPAHYFVLVDEIFQETTNDPVRELETLTYNMCYLYGKATTSVSIPPPVYYADKACDRGRRYLSRVFDHSQRMGDAVRDADVRVHDDLKDTMFYI